MALIILGMQYAKQANINAKKSVKAKQDRCRTFKNGKKQRKALERTIDVSKGIQCDKRNHIMNFQNELLVDKKGGINFKCIACMLSVKKKDQEMSVSKKKDGDMTIETNEHLVNVSF